MQYKIIKPNNLIKIMIPYPNKLFQNQYGQYEKRKYVTKKILEHL